MAYIKEEVINDIRNQADIVDIMLAYGEDITSKGKDYVGHCPFHNDINHPSMHVSQKNQLFNCFSCPAGGNVFNYIMLKENVTFPESISIVAKKIGYKLDIISPNKTNTKYKEDYEIYDFACKYYKNNLATEAGRKARNYLLNRGIDENIINEFNIGLACGEFDAFYKVGTKKNWSTQKLDELGIINVSKDKVYDTFINRIIIPITDAQGRVVAFTGRIYNGEDNSAKYLNTKVTNIFKKSEILFNYYNAKNYIKNKKEVIVVEGNMDAIKMSSKGIKNVIALMGLDLGKERISILKKLNVPIILMLDNDDAGLDGTIKVGNILQSNDFDIRVVRLSGAKDPDEYIEKFGVDALEDNIKHSMHYIDFVLEYYKQGKNLHNVGDIINYVKDILNNFNKIDDLTKEIIVSKISKDYAIDTEILKNSLVKANGVIPKTEEKPIKTSLTKYQKASHKVLYYMLLNNKYIVIYKNRLGYFKERIERVLASEIIYYQSEYGDINIADFITYLMDNMEVYKFLQNILNENYNTIEKEEEFSSCITAILKIYKFEEMERLKQEIKEEMDISKKIALMEEFRKIKKEV